MARLKEEWGCWQRGRHAKVTGPDTDGNPLKNGDLVRIVSTQVEDDPKNKYGFSTVVFARPLNDCMSLAPMNPDFLEPVELSDIFPSGQKATVTGLGKAKDGLIGDGDTVVIECTETQDVKGGVLEFICVKSNTDDRKTAVFPQHLQLLAPNA